MRGLLDINPYDPRLTEAQSRATILMMKKYEQYAYQGRKDDAHGAGTIIRIYWNSITAPHKNVSTGWDELK